MSLKAKIEAVIYASEEPVTLVQLVGLLGLEAQAELDALAARQNTLQLVGDQDLGDPIANAPAAGDQAGAPESPESPEGTDAAADEAAETVPGSAGLEAVAAPGGLNAPAEASDPAAEKRHARERERKLREYLREIVEQLMREYATSDRGLEVREVAGGYRMATKPEYHDAVRGFVKSLKPPLKLSLQALETLAVVAYKQPVTAPEVSEIRGVDSGGVLGSLMARKLITTAGRKQVIGRPILYKTTKDFLVRFGLKDVAELPSIEEFEKMAGELAGQEEIPMPEGSDTKEMAEERITHENLLEEQHVSEPQADGDTTDLEPDESNRPDDGMPAVDGRLSGLPPREDVPGEDPSADEAAIQSGAGVGE
jgi:segregation and condensation protein B